jgi:predicted dienelactone hydrolase
VTAQASPAAFTLPPPTGRHGVGTIALHLVDPARHDPWVPSHPLRELMISIWYPAARTRGYPTAPWMPPKAAAHYLPAHGLPASDVPLLPATAGHVGAPVDRRGGPRPVIVYSPGSHMDRNTGTALVEQLAGDGYIVVTIDHTHDAGEVEFPGGRVEVGTLPPDTREINTEAVAVRAADTSFVLDQLAAIDHGRNPSVEHTPLPQGLKGALKLSRTGMFGFSIGGATTAAAMHNDGRIAAGVNLDGTFYGPVVHTGLNRPFLFFADQHPGDPTWQSTWSHSRGWKRLLHLRGSEHNTFSDLDALYPQAAGQLGLSAAQVAQIIGTIGPDRAISIQRTYLKAFFDQELRHHPSSLLNGPDPAYPEVTFGT